MLEEGIGYLKRMILFYPISSQLFHHNVLSRVIILVPLANYTIKNIHNFCNILLQLHIFFLFSNNAKCKKYLFAGISKKL